jgi:dihydroorotate dehydrogenase (fumarate)
MNLATEYLGLKLSSPFVIGASPLADDLSAAQALEDLGAGAIVMRSLFEEQIYLTELEHAPRNGRGFPAPAADSRDFPAPAEYQMSPDSYLVHLGALKKGLRIPVIASLNGCRPGGWIDFARRCELAGADAIELNLYQIATDPAVSGAEIEAELIETVRMARAAVRIPIAAKISPFLSSPVHFCRQLERAGANGIVLFNRFYQAGFDQEEECDDLRLDLSDTAELLVRLRWLSLLSPQVDGSLAISGGVHGAKDAVKAIGAGADAVQVVSVLLRHGPRILATLTAGLSQWLSLHGYDDADSFRGTLARRQAADAGGRERGDYQRILQSWRI